jgi:Transposase IS4
LSFAIEKKKFFFIFFDDNCDHSRSIKMPPDPRLVVGNIVLAKAIHVTCEAECSRRYGAQKKTKMLQGTVAAIIATKNPVSNRTQKTVEAIYDLGGGTHKRKGLLLRNIHVRKDLPPATAADEVQVATTEVTPASDEVQVTTTEVTPAPVVQVTTTEVTPAPVEAAVLVQVLAPPSLQAVTLETPPRTVPNATTIEPRTAVDQQQVPVPVPNAPAAIVPNAAIVIPTALDPNAGATVVVHEQAWYDDRNGSMRDINGSYHRRQWFMRNIVGDHLTSGHNVDRMMSRLDVFLLMFPPEAINDIQRLTNKQLQEASEKAITKGELIKFFGVLILITRFSFNNRSDLWSMKAWSKYVPSPDFGQTGMSRRRFDMIWRYIRWSDQPSDRPLDMSSEQYRWLLVDGFVQHFNDYRAETFSPSEGICVDESISRWYGQGGEWINHGLPMYVAIERKPENGCEIQSACCGECGIMIRLKVVKTATEERNLQQQEGIQSDASILHGVKVLKELVQPWMFTDRLVVGDSYFASVTAAQELLRHKMRFIGVVKTATKRFPMQYLGNMELNERGDRAGLVSRDEQGRPTFLSFVYMDRDRRYFIATGSSLDEGTPVSRKRWRQVNQERDAPPERMQLTIPQPKAAAAYYAMCGKVDQHNRDRQDTLEIERKLLTHDWSQRVNLTVFAMICVDTWRMYSRMTYPPEEHEVGEVQKMFYANLATELIDNQLDANIRTRFARDTNNDNSNSVAICIRTGAPRCGSAAHLTPTKRFRITNNGTATRTRFQGHCRVCKGKTTHQCSLCIDDINVVDLGWICNTKNGKMCFPQHIEDCHND